MTEEEFIWIYFDNNTTGLLGDKVEPYKEPGLLSVCHDVRREALPIYYKSNYFGAQIYEPLIPKVIAFEKRCKELGVLDAMSMDICPIHGLWWNMTLQWCEHVYGGGKWYPDDKEMEQLDSGEVMYCAALEMTKLLASMEWKVCKQAVELLIRTKEDIKSLGL